MSSHPTQQRRIVKKRREKKKKSNGWHTSFNGVISFEIIIIGHKNYENARKVPNLV